MQTRSKTRALRSKRSIYLSRVKSSHCRGRTLKCFKRYRCKKTRSGKRKSYCRKSHNKHV